MESITYGFDGAFTTYIFENDALELFRKSIGSKISCNSKKILEFEL
ncbi:MAG: hypothetical protein JG779_1424 [Thermotoga sp.]|jgi:hypothetical protein|nr:hypothetical protein [Thermotoga sp.]